MFYCFLESTKSTMNRNACMHMFARKVVDEKNEGRSLVFVDDKLLEWVDEQVEAGKYFSRSHAIECALAEIKERGKSQGNIEVLGRGLPSRLQVQISKVSLEMVLRQKHGDNTEAKIAFLKHLKERVENGLEVLSHVQAVALTEVLNELLRAISIKT